MFSFRLSTFLIGLLALSPLGYGLSTTPAMAHCDGVKHGSGHPHCDGGEPPPPPPIQPQVLAVRDANGAFIGEVFDVETGSREAYLVFRGDPTQSVYFEDNPLVILKIGAPLLSGDPSGFHVVPDNTMGDVFFSEAGCEGIIYIKINALVGLARDFNIPRLPVEEVVGGQILYVPIDPALPFASETVSSSIDGPEPPHSCNSFLPALVDVLTPAMEIPLSFQPPYTIGY